MQRIAFSTDDVPEADRFAYWRETVSEQSVGVSGERDNDGATSFSGKLDGWVDESVKRFRYCSDRFRVRRRPCDMARRNWDDSIILYREFSDAAWFEHAQREFVTRSNDLVIADATLSFATEPRTSFDHEVWLLPRRFFDPHLAGGRCPSSIILRGSEGVAGMIKAYVDAFAAQIDTLADGEVGSVTDVLCRLMAVACGGEAGEQRQAIRLARLADAKRYVGLHLADPDLTPETAASALKISVRLLHLLFEPGGTTFTDYVVKRRLEECRAALETGERSVTDIAFAWGFNSLATFFRRFHEAYGTTPCEMRHQAVRRN